MDSGPVKQEGSDWPAGTFLAGLKEGLRAELLALAPKRRVLAEDVLIRQGEQNHDVLVLRAANERSTACVKIVGSLDSGVEALFGVRVSGDLVGEMAAVRNTARSASVVACSAGFVHGLTKDRFLDFLNRHPEAWHLLAAMIGERLDWANQRRLDFAGFTVQVRLARVLVQLAERHGHPVDGGIDLGVRLSQEELGKLVGAGKESATKAVTQLRAAKLVVTGYRRVLLTDLPGLRSFAELDP